jgi:hypothetical protein
MKLFTALERRHRRQNSLTKLEARLDSRTGFEGASEQYYITCCDCCI